MNVLDIVKLRKQSNRMKHGHLIPDFIMMESFVMPLV